MATAAGAGTSLGPADPREWALSHEAGHLWPAVLGWRGDPHLNPLHLASGLLIGGGFLLLARAWAVRHEAQRAHRLSTTGPYAWVRHPQYGGSS